MRAEIDSVNTVKFNLTVDAIEAIFRTYPTGDVPCEHAHMYTVCAYLGYISSVYILYSGKFSQDKILVDFVVAITSAK